MVNLDRPRAFACLALLTFAAFLGYGGAQAADVGLVPGPGPEAGGGASVSRYAGYFYPRLTRAAALSPCLRQAFTATRPGWFQQPSANHAGSMQIRSFFGKGVFAAFDKGVFAAAGQVQLSPMSGRCGAQSSRRARLAL
jgi:hypothetical protein